jgi:hypothetical protein
MANTTFTGNVRQNGDGNRTSVAGSVEVCAQFHIADFQTAGVRSATKSSTNLTDVLIPKNALISKVQVTCTNAGAANTFDLGLVGVVAGVLDADALVDGGATTNAAIGTYFPGFSFPGASGAANNKQGVSIGTIFSATEQAKIQITGTGAGGAGSAEGYIWYHMIDDGQESA